MKVITKILGMALFLFCAAGYAQTNSKIQRSAFVDDNGVLRWSGSNEEVSLFGVNYTTPFAYAYRAHKRLGLDLKKAIDLDVAQMVRLGLDAFRVHVWDREISDRKGNLLTNEHLDLFDYLIAKLDENGIKSIITPIAWWGTGWPEPDNENPGFSQIYGKTELITNGDARKAERNYLQQFINHVNPYTKFQYKNDPSVIAIEIINEPKHPNDEQQVTDYINEMYDVLRTAGLIKPIFYNISENWNPMQANAVGKSKAQGVSFQWYPTGLVHGKVLNGNYLINVNKYFIPSEDVAGFTKKAKMVYEFDAADLSASYMYPAMARSYREAGMQFATMFAYDPSQIAWSNTEYPTHYLNLLYTPSKAVGLLIASKVFHSLKRNQAFGSYPANNNFEDFRLDGIENLSEMNCDTAFYYTNNTNTLPKDVSKLLHIAGTGSSSIVKYNGTGAYFIDKLENGIWRLEIYPDAIWLKDPFEQTSMTRQAARLYWNERNLSIDVSDLGKDFEVNPLVSNRKILKAEKAEVKIAPGIYLLTSAGVDKSRLEKYSKIKNNFLKGLYVPQNISSEINVINKTPKQTVSNEKLNFKFLIAGGKVEYANLYVKQSGWRGFKKYALKNSTGFDYIADDTSTFSNDGRLQYCVSVKSSKGIITYPGGIQKSPEDWDFSQSDLWSINVCAPSERIVLLDAARDQSDIVFPQFNPSFKFVVGYASGSNSEKNSVSVKVNYSKEVVVPFGLQLNVAGVIKTFVNTLGNYKSLVVKGKGGNEKPGKISVKLLMDDGICFASDFQFSNTWEEIKISLIKFKTDSALILPNSYPQFLPKIWKSGNEQGNQRIDLSKIQFIQVVCDKSYSESENSFKLESIQLEAE
jgi:hypothetical protein